MRLDLHVHTWYSKDGVSPPKKIIKAVTKKREKGLLDGIAITDHDMTKAWKDFRNLGFPVVFGEEIKTPRGEILGLFLNEEITSREPMEVLDEIHSQDGLAVFAHPFDKYRKGFRKPEEFAKRIDGVEAFNSRMRTPGGNEKARRFAGAHNLPITGGSDAHIRWEIGNAFTEAKADNLESFKKALKRGKTHVFGRNSIWVLIPVTKLSKWRIIGRAP
ncbi:MAG: PHP domain-containing protein [Candidatus Diapherotrites archaeon]|nr:PHP domain-containing protein [Candidatus Diapherotrites archaeon]